MTKPISTIDAPTDLESIGIEGADVPEIGDDQMSLTGEGEQLVFPETNSAEDIQLF